jgi:hypothetical protein
MLYGAGNSCRRADALVGSELSLRRSRHRRMQDTAIILSQ